MQLSGVVCTGHKREEFSKEWSSQGDDCTAMWEETQGSLQRSRCNCVSLEEVSDSFERAEPFIVRKTDFHRIRVYLETKVCDNLTNHVFFWCWGQTEDVKYFVILSEKVIDLCTWWETEQEVVQVVCQIPM